MSYDTMLPTRFCEEDHASFNYPFRQKSQTNKQEKTKPKLNGKQANFIQLIQMHVFNSTEHTSYPWNMCYLPSLPIQPNAKQTLQVSGIFCTANLQNLHPRTHRIIESQSGLGWKGP